MAESLISFGPWFAAQTRHPQPQATRLVLDLSTPPQTTPSLLSALITLAVLPFLPNVGKLEMMPHKNQWLGPAPSAFTQGRREVLFSGELRAVIY